MIINHAINTKFRIVEGYRAFPDAMLALQRGEVAGICNTYSQIVAREELMRERKLNVLFFAEEDFQTTGSAKIKTAHLRAIAAKRLLEG